MDGTLTYAGYLAACAEEGVTEPLTRWQFQALMLRRGLALAAEDELSSEWDVFSMLCYPGAPGPASRHRKVGMR